MSPSSSIVLIAPVDPKLEGLLTELGRTHSIIAEGKLRAMSAPGSPLPGVIVADVRQRPGMVSELGAIKQTHPQAGIVIVASLDPQTMLAAMRAGITECVTEPLDAQQLDAALSRVAAPTQARHGEVFAFLGAKGGVGTTTLAVNVATVLASTKKPVLFADLNVAYGDAAIYFGAEPRFSLVDALDNTSRLDESFLKSLVVPTKSKVDLLGSAERDPGRPIDFRGLRSLIELAARSYSFVILDVPRAGRAVVDPLEKADSIVVVTNHELTAIRSAGHLASVIRERYGSKRVSIVVSRFDRKSELTETDIEKAVGESIRHIFPSDYRVALEALNKGRPLVLDNHTKLASSIEKFTRGLAKIEQPQAESASRSGLLGRLGGRK